MVGGRGGGWRPAAEAASVRRSNASRRGRRRVPMPSRVSKAVFGGGAGSSVETQHRRSTAAVIRSNAFRAKKPSASGSRTHDGHVNEMGELLHRLTLGWLSPGRRLPLQPSDCPAPRFQHEGMKAARGGSAAGRRGRQSRAIGVDRPAMRHLCAPGHSKAWAQAQGKSLTLGPRLLRSCLPNARLPCESETPKNPGVIPRSHLSAI